jgi:hypothetical protein
VSLQNSKNVDKTFFAITSGAILGTDEYHWYRIFQRNLFLFNQNIFQDNIFDLTLKKAFPSSKLIKISNSFLT